MVGDAEGCDHYFDLLPGAGVAGRPIDIACQKCGLTGTLTVLPGRKLKFTPSAPTAEAERPKTWRELPPLL